MELQFRETKLRCLRRSAADIQNTEQTLELRLPENLPPVGRVLGAWGQCLLRSKEWKGDLVIASGGVMVQALYEGEEGGVHCVQGWIPFSLRWELEGSGKDGSLMVSCLLRSVDARQIGAEKLLLRASISASAQALEEEDYSVWKPDSLPEGLQLLEKTHNPCVAVEAGEKRLSLEEELVLPPGQVDMESLLFYQLKPSVKEQKLVSDKLVFRGSAALHAVYMGRDGMLHAFDTQLPISQFSQLREEYSEAAAPWVIPAVTDLELQQLDESRVRLKAELLGQYVVYDTLPVTVVEDACCPGYDVSLTKQAVHFPWMKERTLVDYSAELTREQKPTAAVVYTAQPGSFADRAELEGVVECLYYDEESRLQWESLPFSSTVPLSGLASGWLTDAPSLETADGRMRLEGQLWVNGYEENPVEMASGLRMEEQQPDPNRPSLILRRAGELSLWELAKKYGSTVETIKEANDLQEEPEPERMLLIPVL